MAKLENSLKIDITPVDSDISTDVVNNVHKAIDGLKGSLTHDILKSEKPSSIKLVSGSFPKPPFGDHTIHGNNIILWPDANNPIEDTVKKVLPKVALATLVNKIKTEDPVVDSTKEPNVLQSNYNSARIAQATKIKNQRRAIIHKQLVDASKSLWDNKAHLSSGIKRRIKDPKGQVSPQLITFTTKLFHDYLTKGKGRPLSIHTNRLIKQHPNLKEPILKISNILEKLKQVSHKL